MEVGLALTEKMPYGETLNRWTQLGMMSVSRQWTEMSGKNGLLDVHWMD